MISIIIENENIIQEGKIFIRDKDELNHLKNSFRVKEGEIIRGTDGEYEYIFKITFISKKEIQGDILEKNEDRYSSEVEITAALGMLKNDKMNLTIQKLTEIGIDKIVPFFSKRCIVKLNEKKDKWDTISKEALKQCQGVKFVDIKQPQNLKDIDFSEYDLVLVPYEASKDENLKNIFSGLKIKPRKIIFVIGPEGGFDFEEIEYLKESGAKIVTLGNRILRAETAAIVVGGVLINGL
ncbi:MAG: RsmE family RNA methyltransferase [Fusobacteriaceae bacterium]